MAKGLAEKHINRRIADLACAGWELAEQNYCHVVLRRGDEYLKITEHGGVVNIYPERKESKCTQ